MEGCGFSAPNFYGASTVGNPQYGDIIFDTSTNNFFGYTTSGWSEFSPPYTPPLTTKGDILGYSTTATRLPVGSNGDILTADSTQPFGIAWEAPAATVPSGSIVAFGGSSAPSGWLLCNGEAVSRTTYANLFAAIGTTYGDGDGSTTFNLPNAQGVFLRGAGSQAVGGITYSSTLGASENDQLQGHEHVEGMNNASGTPGMTVSVSSRTLGNVVSWGSTTTAQRTGTVGPVSDGTNGTPRIGTETRPVNISVNYIIKY
jgi:microcystin-dependent protein